MNNKIFDKKTYNYNLPNELIAQTPVEPRDSSRLLVYNREEQVIDHKKFYNIVDYLKKDDVLVINSTKVLPARIIGTKQATGAKIEFLLLKKMELDVWEVLIKPSKRISENTKIFFDNNLEATVTEKKKEGIAVVKFNYTGNFEEILLKIGKMPLPHYIRKIPEDTKTSYQTVYAKKLGSSAAPTAGLHFTDELLEKIKKKGVKVVEVLLHVGLGTFRPVKDDDISKHVMHSEYYEISKQAADTINKAKSKKKNVVSVGTTVVRTLESNVENGKIKPGMGDTDIFIYPGYRFKIIDKIITNFHLPESTLIMLVSAFAGIENTLNIYEIAVKEKYRFFSFGDAMLIN